MDEASSGSATFAERMRCVRNGDERAAWELVEQYGAHVQRAVRRLLRQDLRAKFDSQDFSQAVWSSFFAATDRFANIEEPGQLVRLLTTIARNKVLDETRRLLNTARSTVRREEPLDATEPGQEKLESRDPRPSEVAVARERWERMWREAPADHREVMRLKLMGWTQRAIAESLSVSEKTVYRILARLERLE